MGPSSPPLFVMSNSSMAHAKVVGFFIIFVKNIVES